MSHHPPAGPAGRPRRAPGMAPERRRHLEAVMASLAADPTDTAAFDALYDGFGDVIRGCLRRHLRELGVMAVSSDDLDGLALDVVFELCDLAGAWRPDGGALPWNWAWSRLRRLASEHVGQHADPLDDEHHDLVDPGSPLAGSDGRTAREIAASCNHPALSGLVADLGAVASDRDVEVWLEHTLQKAHGDPSPANTIARERGLKPDAVRQIVCRTKKKVDRLLAQGDPGFGVAA